MCPLFGVLRGSTVLADIRDFSCYFSRNTVISEYVAALQNAIIGASSTLASCFMLYKKYQSTYSWFKNLMIGTSLSEPHTSESLKNTHSLFGRTYVRQCHGLWTLTKISYIIPYLVVHTFDSVTEFKTAQSHKLFHFRSNVRSTVMYHGF